MLSKTLLASVGVALALTPLSASASVLRRAATCKCTADQSCWPSQSEFASLSQTLSKPVFAVHPVGAPCHDPLFNQAECSNVQANYFDGLWRSDQPGASMSQIWESNDNITAVCTPFNTTETASCDQGRVPVVGVNATTAADVQNAVRFALKHNLKTVVKNTGHDFLGRGFAFNSFLIWTHFWGGMNFTSNFTPDGGSATGFPAVTIGPGVQWGELYEFVNTKNLTIAGGIGPQGSVGAGGGWPLGGGHNILSPHLGLGVDNILQINVVTPTGDYLIANANQNTDLFWALRGGGGPNFGIATSITFRLHPNPPLYAYFFEATFGNESFAPIMNSWHEALPAIADAGWSGYYPFSPNFFALMYLLPNGNATFANATMGPWVEQVKQIPGINVTTDASIVYPGFFEWFDANILDPVDVIGFNYTGGATMGNSFAPASWMLPRTLFEDNSTINAMTSAFGGFAEGIGQHVGGGVVAAASPDSVGAHPAWRSCLVDVAISGFWDASASLEEITAIRQGISTAMNPLRDLTPGPLYAQYLNEPDLLEPNFTAANWGTHYPELLAIKQKYDPNSLFIVRQGVGSEFWDENQVCPLN